KAGAVDYLAKPADADDVVRALLAAHAGEAPPPPENPMSADRVRWEHIQRIYELCGHNVSETARRLNMHRRTLQRILAKRAPKKNRSQKGRYSPHLRSTRKSSSDDLTSMIAISPRGPSAMMSARRPLGRVTSSSGA